MDGYLFDIEELTDRRIREAMANHYCRQCGNLLRTCGKPKNAILYCQVRKSGRSKNGLLKVKSNQPACILFTNQNDAK